MQNGTNVYKYESVHYFAFYDLLLFFNAFYWLILVDP